MITEADIQAELIEGWEINDILHEDEGSALRFVIITNPSLRIEIYSPVSFGNIDFYHGDLEDDVCKDVSLSDFLTGNYDLSAISQHYEPEEWQRIITMCERIVRLITGEQVEQSLEEKVREILEPLKTVELIHVDEHTVNLSRVNEFKLYYWITSNSVEHDRSNVPLGDSLLKCSISEYPTKDNGEEWTNAVISIAALLAEQPEQTLEEAVRGHLKGITYDNLFVSDDVVCFDRYNNHDPIQYVISKEWAFSGVDGDLKKTDPRDDVTGREGFDGIHLAVHNIAADLSTRSTKPSYSRSNQRVEELEAKLKSCETKYRGRMQELQQVREDYTNCSSVYGQKIEKLQEQLDGAVSEADHEREIKEWEAAFEAERKNRMDQTRLATKYHQWFEEAHAERLKLKEASQ